MLVGTGDRPAAASRSRVLQLTCFNKSRRKLGRHHTTSCVENPRDTAHLELGMLVMALGLPVTLAFNFPFFNIQSTQKPPAAAELRDALVAGSSDMDVIQLLVDQCIDARVPFRAVCTPTLF